MSHEVRVICTYAHLSPLVDQLREYCIQSEAYQLAHVSDSLISHKLSHACIHVEFPHHQVEGALISLLERDSRVIDYYLVEYEDEKPEQEPTYPISLLSHGGRHGSNHPLSHVAGPALG